MGEPPEHTHEGDLVREAQPIVGAPPQGDLSSVGFEEGGIADQAGAGDFGVGDRHGSVRNKRPFWPNSSAASTSSSRRPLPGRPPRSAGSASISAGLQELAAGPQDDDAAGRLRGPGAGREALAEHDAELVAALERLVDPATRGDPTGPLRWTCSSAARLSRELQEGGHRVSERSVNRLLHALGYSLQANRKTLEGKQHPDRDAQFNHINRRVRAFQRRRQPVVSVDTKKKELVGPFKNAGREWRPHGHPEPVRVHDFPDKTLGKAIPYGVYDLTHDAGWVSVGVDHDTASFAVETLRRWWRRMGCVSYPVARRLLITADGGVYFRTNLVGTLGGALRGSG